MLLEYALQMSDVRRNISRGLCVTDVEEWGSNVTIHSYCLLL